MPQKILLRCVSLLIAVFTLVNCTTTQSKGQKGKYSDELSLDEMIFLAETGHDKAQHALCYRYKYGNDGAPKDLAKAFKWCQIQAKKGNNRSQTLLGEMYYNGEYVAQDNTEALHWYTLAATNEHVFAMFMVYYMYRFEYDTTYDLKKAAFWLQQAQKFGQPDLLNSKPDNLIDCASFDINGAAYGTYLVDEHDQWTLVERSMSVKIKQGITFGLKLDLMTKESLNQNLQNFTPLKVRWTHPPLTNPQTNSTSSSSQGWEEIDFQNASSPFYVGYELTHRWEMQPGQWTVELFCDDNLMFTQNFELVD
ncbi:MAG: DUF3859 domain-containing protein [Algicola sp.]|nr:DUF3859 domain-containing protein [Algicola sp.]